MKQVAFKRGFINLQNLALYSKDDTKDGSGNIINDYLFLNIILSSTDFIKEETLLYYMTKSAGNALGLAVAMESTPKGHPDLVIEGTKHS
eukprot:4779109-Ditylum_brightwellii.AAC.1